MLGPWGLTLSPAPLSWSLNLLRRAACPFGGNSSNPPLRQIEISGRCLISGKWCSEKVCNLFPNTVELKLCLCCRVKELKVEVAGHHGIFLSLSKLQHTPIDVVGGITEDKYTQTFCSLSFWIIQLKDASSVRMRMLILTQKPLSNTPNLFFYTTIQPAVSEVKRTARGGGGDLYWPVCTSLVQRN